MTTQDGGAPEPDEDALSELAGRVFELARSGRCAELLPYLNAGLPINLANDSGDTLLMLAAYHGRTEVVDALLSRGADPDRTNDRGQSPLAGAIFKGEDDVVRALVAAGADPGAGTPTARDTARMFGRADLVELLSAPG